MASSTVTRRPLPALVALLALLILTALVWWRVLHRSSGSQNSGASPPCPSSSTSSTPSSTPSPSLPAPDSVTVVVLNSTNRSGIAGQAQASLLKDGFRSPRPAGNDDKHHNKIKGVAQIRFGAKAKPAATLVQYYLPGARLVQTHSKRSVVTISLGKRYHHVASPRQVRAAMRNNGVGESTAPSTSASHSPGC